MTQILLWAAVAAGLGATLLTGWLRRYALRTEWLERASRGAPFAVESCPPSAPGR